eukprot:COSAG01_NODE_53945_length_335_cov_1.720339_1_plen_21_part_10
MTAEDNRGVAVGSVAVVGRCD